MRRDSPTPEGFDRRRQCNYHPHHGLPNGNVDGKESGCPAQGEIVNQFLRCFQCVIADCGSGCESSEEQANEQKSEASELCEAMKRRDILPITRHERAVEVKLSFAPKSYS